MPETVTLTWTEYQKLLNSTDDSMTDALTEAILQVSELHRSLLHWKNKCAEAQTALAEKEQTWVERYLALQTSYDALLEELPGLKAEISALKAAAIRLRDQSAGKRQW